MPGPRWALREGPSVLQCLSPASSTELRGTTLISLAKTHCSSSPVHLPLDCSLNLSSAYVGFTSSLSLRARSASGQSVPPSVASTHVYASLLLTCSSVYPPDPTFIKRRNHATLVHQSSAHIWPLVGTQCLTDNRLGPPPGRPRAMLYEPCQENVLGKQQGPNRSRGLAGGRVPHQLLHKQARKEVRLPWPETGCCLPTLSLCKRHSRM